MIFEIIQLAATPGSSEQMRANLMGVLGHLGRIPNLQLVLPVFQYCFEDFIIQ